MLLEAIILSLIVGIVRKGNLKRLGQLELRNTWLIFLPVGLMVLMYVFRKLFPSSELGEASASFVHIAAYLVVLIAIFSNKHLPGMALIGLGALLNFAAIMANDGKMPVSREAVKAVHMEKALQKDMVRHCIIDSDTRLCFLSDIIPTPKYSFGGVMSIGDGVLAIGLFLLIQHGICPRKRRSDQLIPTADLGG